MARTNNNKYTSINFNHILEKNARASSNPSSGKPKHPQSPLQHPSSPFSSYCSVSSPTKTHGRMLVLTRPTPKPLTVTPPLSPNLQNLPQKEEIQPVQPRKVPDPAPASTDSDQISLGPAGRIGSGLAAPVTVPKQEREKEVGADSGSAKLGKFVPPHLRPGFSRREKPGPEVYRGRESAQRQFGSPVLYGDDGRPKSGGHERMRRVGDETDLGLMGRPRSSGSRPSSRGWYAAFP